MNFIPSLLLYNPLEAMEILLLVGIFSKYKYDKFELLFHSFLYGAINLIFQYSASILMGTFSYTVITCLNSYIVYPAVLYLYCNSISNIKINFKYSYIIRVGFNLFSLMLVIILNYFSILELFNPNMIILKEFIVNMIIRLPQIIFVGIIYYRKRLC